MRRRIDEADVLIESYTPGVTGRLNIDFLDTLAITASLLQGNPMAGAIVTWLIKLGDWIRDLTAAGSRRAINELLEFQSKTAWVTMS